MRKHEKKKLINDSPIPPFGFDHYLNLPDLQFFIWCSDRYQINRGVYNTIDQWFFDYGVINIQCRRIQLLVYFDFLQDDLSEKEERKFIRFGHGGLKKRLLAFMRDREVVYH